MDVRRIQLLEHVLDVIRRNYIVRQLTVEVVVRQKFLVAAKLQQPIHHIVFFFNSHLFSNTAGAVGLKIVISFLAPVAGMSRVALTVPTAQPPGGRGARYRRSVRLQRLPISTRQFDGRASSSAKCSNNSRP